MENECVKSYIDFVLSLIKKYNAERDIDYKWDNSLCFWYNTISNEYFINSTFWFQIGEMFSENVSWKHIANNKIQEYIKNDQGRMPK